MIDSTHDIEFRERQPLYWLNKSTDLRGSAGALHYCMKHQRAQEIAKKLGLGKSYDMTAGTYSVYRMLCGMSLELLFKAVITVKGRKVPQIHNLEKLAEEAGVKYGNDERPILALLTECIVWDGRYPIPKKADSLDYFTWLTFEYLYVKKPFGKNGQILQPKKPNPLGWKSFNKLWKKGSKEFFEYYS